MTRKIARTLDVQPLPGDGQVERKQLVLMPRDLREYDPFLFLAEDWFGKPLGFEAHPHRGFETVTYVVAGAVEHRDNHGHAGVLRAGDVQWMTAGRGIVHSEMPFGDETVHSLQLWLNLPRDKKMIETRYQDVRGADVPVRRASGAELRVYSGRSGDVVSPTLNHWPVTMIEARLDGGAIAQELPAAYRGFAYVLDGAGTIGGTPLRAGQVAWFDAGDDTELTLDGKMRALLFAGLPIGEPIAARGPFVMNTAAEVAQAFADYRAGRF
jgi:redox-sensitive bicupin YhaK (pirin superfamily)